MVRPRQTVSEAADGLALILRAAPVARAKRSFLEFVRMVRPAYDLQWFHELLCDELQVAATAPHDTRLGLAMPPGHAKSEYALLLIAWAIARDPNVTVKYITYSQTFAEAQFRRLKEILNSDEYVSLFGRVINDRASVSDAGRGKKNTSHEFEILGVGARGWVSACGFGGGITGGRCDIVVMDDPFKGWEDSHSPTTREARWKDYTSAIKTRRRVGRPLRILMLFTRWHLDDLTGRCQAKEKAAGWRWVALAALREEGEGHPRDPRAPGEALWPAVLTREQAEQDRDVDPETFQALYQQRPVADGGNVYKATWFTRRWQDYELQALLHLPGMWVQSWDTRHGGKDETSSSQVAGHLYFFPSLSNECYLIDIVAGRWDTTETIARFDECQRNPLWARATACLVENKSDGVTLLSQRQGKIKAAMIAIKPLADKLTRARAVTPFCHAQRVILPETHPLVGEVHAELTTFPASATNDHVDTLSQVLTWRWVEPVKTDAPLVNPLEAARRRAGALL
jgi:predicted phage terminase large subunit-like protein